MSTVLRLKPAEVALHPGNIRDSTRDLAALTASIKEVGVLVPLIVAPIDDIRQAFPDAEFPAGAGYVAVDGNRRRRACEDLDVELPCVVADPEEQRPELTMAVTNLVRDGLTTMETVAAVQEMLDVGLSQAAIARATGIKAKQLRTAKKAAELPAKTIAAAADHDLNLEQLAALTEFSDDQVATQQLIAAAKRNTYEFERSAEQLRRASKIRREVAKRTEQLAAAGVRVVADLGWTRADLSKGPVLVSSLQVDEDEHQSCPGRVVAVRGRWDSVDVEEGCSDPDGNGHVFHACYDRAGSGAATSGASEEDQAAADESRKEERRELIRRNKEAAAAQPVRIRFAADRWRLTTPEMRAWMLARLARGDHRFARWMGTWSHKVGLHQIVGGDHEDVANRKARDAPPSQHAGLIWARIVCAEEDEFTKDAWRHGADQSRADYLRHLVELGYELGETEQLIVDNAAAAAEKGEPDEDEDGEDLDFDEESWSSERPVESVEVGGDLL